MQAPWIKLLKQGQDANYFGLTVPFLYGALDRWPGSPLGTDVLKERFIRLLYLISTDTPPDNIIRLYSCERLDDLTFSIVGDVSTYCTAITSSKRLSPCLYVERSLAPNGKISSDELSEHLWPQYEFAITNLRFSLQKRVYMPFTPSEIELIDSAINRSEDDEK